MNSSAQGVEPFRGVGLEIADRLEFDGALVAVASLGGLADRFRGLAAKAPGPGVGGSHLCVEAKVAVGVVGPLELEQRVAEAAGLQ